MGKNWSQPIRLETPDHKVHITTRTLNSVLWFVNNKNLEERVYAFLAKYVEKYNVELYAFTLLGNHYHLVARFPLENMAQFERDFNARIAESVRILVPEFPGGALWGRRYCNQIIEGHEALLHYIHYTFLQPVSSKLTRRISDYTGKSFLSDAASGRERRYKYFSYGEYRDAKLKNPRVSRKKFWRYHTLRFTKIETDKELTSSEYKKYLMDASEKKRQEFLQRNIDQNKGVEPNYMTKEEVRKVKPGTRPYSTKKGGRRPIVLCFHPLAKKLVVEWYLTVVAEYREACEKFRDGNFNVEFPLGTYRPAGLSIRAYP